MNANQREMLMTCLTQVFGRVEDAFVEDVAPHLRWIELSGGETLFEEGDPEDGVYLVISGRLRALVREGEGRRAISEIMRGETIGEMAVLTHEPRSATVVAVRDSVLAHVTQDALTELMARHPQIPIHMARVIISRLKRSSARPVIVRPVNLCVLAITEGVDAAEFGERLVASLERWGVATLETSASIDARFGPGAAESTGAEPETYHKVTQWLDDVEFWNEYVVFATDGRDSQWTRRCVRHADEILLVARADAPVRLHPLEEAYFAGPRPLSGAKQILTLVHDPATALPSNTTAWLDRRPVDAHLHVRAGHSRDMTRLARILSGNAVGLVLAGGGARGFAHLGVYRALEEAGVAVDYVGGTSIGAAMGTYIAIGLPAAAAIEKARRVFAENPTGDLNLLPLISLIRGKRMKRSIERAVVEAAGFAADVADTWRTFFCVATNFSRASEIVLTRGPLASSVRASVSIPVALPPVLREGDLLVDGGSFNNFPTDVMARLGVRRIIGVDLSRERTRKYDFEEVPSPWAMLIDRFRPAARRRFRLPSLGAVLVETTLLYSSSRQGQARQSVDLYLNPDLGRISLLEWAAFDRIVEIGYRHAQDLLRGLSEEQLAPYRDLPEASPEA